MRARCGMVGRKIAQHLCHARGDPAVTSAPKERHIGRVVEEPVGLLQLVEVCHHLLSVAVQVLAIAR